VEELLAVTQQFPRWKPVLDGALGPSLALMPLDQLTALLTGQYKAHNFLLAIPFQIQICYIGTVPYIKKTSLDCLTERRRQRRPGFCNDSSSLFVVSL
jgi:hypothetical protein